MPTPTPADFGRYITKIPVRDQVDQANIPIEHFDYASAHALRMVDYLVALKRKTRVYEKGFERHLKGVCSLALLQMIAAFERFLKELAAICVDEIAPICSDNRLKDFKIDGVNAAPHFRDQTIGRGLCESQLWHDVDQVNDRSKSILRSMTTPIRVFMLFDEKSPHTFPDELKTLRVVFQLRHTLAHNLGSLTRSDSAKLERLLGRRLESPKELDVDRKYVWYVQRFLALLASKINGSVAARLGLVLTEFHHVSPELIDPQTKATQLAKSFRIRFTISTYSMMP